MPPGIRFPERDELWVPYRPSRPVSRARARARFVAGFGLLRDGVSSTAPSRSSVRRGAVARTGAPRHEPRLGRPRASFRDSGGRPERSGARHPAPRLRRPGVAHRLWEPREPAPGPRRRPSARDGRADSLWARNAAISSATSWPRRCSWPRGGVLGVAQAWGLTDLVVASFPEDLPYWVRLDLDCPRLAVHHVASGPRWPCGLVPALRTSRPDVVVRAERGRERRGARAEPSRIQQALVVGQVALCVGLLVGANLLIRSFLSLQAAPRGGSTEDAPTHPASLPGRRCLRRGGQASRAAPRARAPASLPCRASGRRLHLQHPHGRRRRAVRLAIERQPVPPGDEPAAIRIAVSPRSSTRSAPALLRVAPSPRTEHASPSSRRGDRQPGARPTLLARGSARPAAGPRRRRRTPFRGSVTWLRVVGIAPDIQYEEFGEETAQSRLNVFLPYGAVPGRSLALLVRTADDPARPGRRRSPVFRELDPSLALTTCAPCRRSGPSPPGSSASSGT